MEVDDVYKNILPHILSIVEIDKQVQNMLLDKNPSVSGDQIAMDDFENALLTNQRLLDSFPQYLDCKPLMQQRKDEIETIQKLGGNCQGMIVSDFRKISELSQKN